MSEYQIIFRGDIVVGQALADVKARASRMFKVEPTQVDKLFNGAAVVLKRGLTQDQAKQYKDTLKQAGMLVDVKAVKVEQEQPSAPEFKLAPTGARIGPKARVDAPDIPTDHIQVTEQEGYLLTDEERAQPEVAPVEPGAWSLADIGADLLAASEKMAEVEALPAPDFGLAEVGVRLSEPKKVVEAAINTDHLQLD